MRSRPPPAAPAQVSPALYPWSVDAQQAERLARGGGFPTLLFAGLRAILMLPVRPGAVFAGAGACMALVIIATLLGIAGEWWLVAEEGDVFDWLALRTAWYDMPVILLGGAWLAQAPRPGWFRRRQPVVSGTPTPALHFAAAVENCALAEYNPQVLSVANRFLVEPVRIEGTHYMTPVRPGLGIELRGV